MRHTGTVCAWLCLLLPPAVLAQDAQRSVAQPPRDALELSVGAEPHLTSTLAYTHGFDAPSSRAGLRLGAGVQVAPLALVPHGAWRVHAIATGSWRFSRRWGATLHALPFLVHDASEALEAYGLGLELRGAVQRSGPLWGYGLDLGWQGTFRSHVEHRGFSRSTFEGRYPDGVQGTGAPRDGWYAGTAQRYRLGFTGARALGGLWALQLAAGALFNAQHQGVLLSFDLGQIPVYAELGVRLGW